MYKVTVGGVFAGYSDTAVYVKVAENGSYIPCDPAEAGGVCVKLPYEHTDEDGNTVKTAEDIVFKFPAGSSSEWNRRPRSRRRAGRSSSNRPRR